MATQLGNFGGAYRSDLSTGSGRSHSKAPFGHVTVGGETGEVVVIPISALFPKMGTMFKGVYAQAMNSCAVSIKSTLADVDTALNPAQAAVFVGAVTASAGSIVSIGGPATALQVTFTTGGVLYLAGV